MIPLAIAEVAIKKITLQIRYKFDCPSPFCSLNNGCAGNVRPRSTSMVFSDADSCHIYKKFMLEISIYASKRFERIRLYFTFVNKCE